MSMPTTIVVERFIAAGPQQLACGHVIAKGDSLVDLRFGAIDDPTARTIGACSDCWNAIGRLGAPMCNDLGDLRLVEKLMGVKRLELKRPDQCVACGVDLAVGTEDVVGRHASHDYLHRVRIGGRHNNGDRCRSSGKWCTP